MMKMLTPRWRTLAYLIDLRWDELYTKKAADEVHYLRLEAPHVFVCQFKLDLLSVPVRLCKTRVKVFPQSDIMAT